MDDYISRQKMLKVIRRMDGVGGMAVLDREAVENAVNNAPAADVVKVVRCKDCKYYGNEELHVIGGDCGWFDGIVDRDDFCSYGERRVE